MIYAMKGFGFRALEGGGKDVYVHHSAIEGSAYGELSDGQHVAFASQQAANGPQATRVRPA